MNDDGPGAAAVEVMAPGLFTTVQDIRGRAHLARFGVATGGAMDPFATRAANLLVGNAPEAALLEVTLSGPILRFSAPTVFAISGADLGATLEAQPVAPGWSWRARAGATLAFGERRSGARAYVAFAGGLQVSAVLGSCAADTRAGFSGVTGRALRVGDHLPIAPVDDLPARAARYLPLAVAHDVIRVLPGPHLGHFSSTGLEQLCSSTWRVADQADRMGYRLLGPSLEHVKPPGVASLGLPLGAIQVPGDGRPIVLLADHQPTGGYTVIACVIRADVPLLAQRAPGDEVRFSVCTRVEARSALQERFAQLQPVEPEALAWASLRWAT